MKASSHFHWKCNKVTEVCWDFEEFRKMIYLMTNSISKLNFSHHFQLHFCDLCCINPSLQFSWLESWFFWQKRTGTKCGRFVIVSALPLATAKTLSSLWRRRKQHKEVILCLNLVNGEMIIRCVGNGLNFETRRQQGKTMMKALVLFFPFAFSSYSWSFLV